MKRKDGSTYQSTIEATHRYDAKSYTRFVVRLRKDEDKDILEYISKAREKGESSREWIRELFDLAFRFSKTKK